MTEEERKRFISDLGKLKAKCLHHVKLGIPKAPYLNSEEALVLLDLIPQILLQKQYDPSFGDDKICQCGHAYYRHFDTYEEMSPVGCKYCYGSCIAFKEK